MTMELIEDYQFALGGVAFGIGLPIECEADGFSPGSATLENQVENHPTSHGVVPGRDRRRSATWGWTLYANGTDPADALQRVAALADAWWNEDLDETPGMVLPLQYRLAGRTRVVYGRPRRWTVSPGNRMISGMLPITADFEVVYPTYFDLAEQSIELTANSVDRPVAGIQAPLVSPLIGVGGGEPISRSVTIGGGAETWVMLDFTGGIDPWVEIGGFRYQLAGTLGGNETVTVDPRPWSRGITSDRGGSFNSTRTSRLAAVKLKPGKYDVVYGNLDFGSPASVRIRWQNAHKSL